MVGGASLFKLLKEVQRAERVNPVTVIEKTSCIATGFFWLLSQ